MAKNDRAICVSVSIPASLYFQIRHEAEEANSTISAMVRTLCLESLEVRENAKNS